MKRAAVLLLFFVACATRPPVAPAPAPAADPAILAEIQRIEGLIAAQPRNLPYMYILATYYDRAHDVKNVVRWLTRLDELEWQLGLGPDSFPNTSSAPAFRRIAAKLEAREPAVHRARTAFTFPTLRSEGVTLFRCESAA